MYFWLGKTDETLKSWSRAFDALRQVRDRLSRLLKDYRNLQVKHEESYSIKIVKELGFDKADFDVAKIYSRIPLSIQELLM